MEYVHTVEPGKKFALGDIDPSDSGPFEGKSDPRARAQLENDLARLNDLQQRLYAESKQSLLVVLQAMDTGGKDGVLRRVVGPLDSRAVHVVNFKAPNAEELTHDFLWRVHHKTPRRGEMVFFNRSHYEDVLVVRALDLAPKSVWSKRYDHINCFEQLLSDSGTRIVKFYLHISRDEQKRRLQERLDDPEKNWKFDEADLKMRVHWDEFISAYDDALTRCNTDGAPWYVVPANRKWFRDIAVASTLVKVLEEMAPSYPKRKDFDPKKIVIPD